MGSEVETEEEEEEEERWSTRRTERIAGSIWCSYSEKGIGYGKGGDQETMVSRVELRIQSWIKNTQRERQRQGKERRLT